MIRITNEQLLEGVMHYINDPKPTQASAAKKAGISKKGFQLNVDRIAEVYPTQYKLYSETIAKSTVRKAKNRTFTPRSAKITPEQREEIIKLKEEGQTCRQIAQSVGVSKTTVSEIAPGNSNQRKAIVRDFVVYPSYERSYGYEQTERKSTR